MLHVEIFVLADLLIKELRDKLADYETKMASLIQVSFVCSIVSQCHVGCCLLIDFHYSDICSMCVDMLSVPEHVVQ